MYKFKLFESIWGSILLKVSTVQFSSMDAWSCSLLLPHSDATKYLSEILSTLNEREQEDWLERIVETVRKQPCNVSFVIGQYITYLMSQNILAIFSVSKFKPQYLSVSLLQWYEFGNSRYYQIMMAGQLLKFLWYVQFRCVSFSFGSFIPILFWFRVPLFVKEFISAVPLELLTVPCCFCSFCYFLFVI